MKRWVGVVVAFLLILPGAAAYAAPPATINIHGSLTASDNSPLTGDRAYSVAFYDASTGGNALGSALTGTVTLTDKGLFNIAITPPTEIFSALQVWYELAIDSDATPNGVDANDSFPTRTQVQKVPFAFQAEEAKHVDAAGIGNGDVDNATLSLLNGVTANVQSQFNSHVTAISSKADASNVYAKSETYSKTEVDGKLFTWETISGATAQMEPNHGYILTGAVPCVLTLPPSTSLAIGDTVRVNAVGEAGFSIAQNEDQFVYFQALPEPVWTARGSDRNWICIASSSDGAKLAACAQNNYIYTSTDSGQTWIPRMNDNTRNWQGVASSSDGVKLAAVNYSSSVHTSTDSGGTWTTNTTPGMTLSSIASSSDGTKLIAGDDGGGAGGYLYTSTDSGTTWTPRAIDSARTWRHVASSTDGVHLIACGGGYLHTSTDSGETWTPRMTDTTRNWMRVASSADGTKLIACVLGEYVYTSTNSGQDWTPRLTDSTRNWYAAASSADGTRLIVGQYNGHLFTSSDSGATWLEEMTDITRSWFGAASSSDGSKLAACEYNGGQLYTMNRDSKITTPGITGSFDAEANHAVELQYVGNNKFKVISHEGDAFSKT